MPKDKKYFKSVQRPPKKASSSSHAEKSILNTLCYSAVFNYPLSFYQLSTFLITRDEFSHAVFERELRDLVKKKVVKVSRGKYYLSGIRPVGWHFRAKNTLAQFDSLTLTFKALEKIPWVKFLGVTGALASHNTTKDDDVDVFIVAGANRIWLTRFFVVLTLKILGKYRTDENSAGNVCPNIYVDETTLAWDEESRNLFVAHDLLKMHPIINRDDTYFKLLKSNEWAFDYFGNFKIQLPETVEIVPSESALINFLEKVFMLGQTKYMKKRKTTEAISKNFIHFKRIDNTQRVLKNYKSIKSKFEKKKSQSPLKKS